MMETTADRIETKRPSPAGGTTTQLTVRGMTCNNCARHVTEALQSVAGVQSASVNRDAGQATVRWAAGVAPDAGALVGAIRQEGYDGEEMDAGAPAPAAMSLAGWGLNLAIGLPVTAILMLGEWVFRLQTQPWFAWLSLALAAAVQIIAGARFYRGAWQQLKVGSFNMDTLVALGSTTAFAYSTWALLSGYSGHLYFMEAASIITLISLGHWLESRVSARASDALRHLLNLAPERARRRDADGTEVEVPVSEVKAGDRLVLRAGDRVPTDGNVVEGESAVDESMLTGESVPVDKIAGNLVYAGTVNLNGRLLVHVTGTGEETALAHVIAAVQRAQTSRANIQRIGDRVSNVFVPIVIGVALLAGLWWGLVPHSALGAHEWLARFLWTAHPPAALAAGFIIAAAVLIIACPCAMGLATPAAIMAGSNAAARRGILIRDGVALEKAGLVTGVVFDKTGTLTTGKPVVVKTWQASGDLAGSGTKRPLGEPDALRLAAALGRHSTHPLSQAAAALAAADLALVEWKEVPGAGVQARWGEGTVGGLARLGSLRWLESVAVDLTKGRPFVEEWSAQGATIVGVALEKRLLGLLAIRDTLKAGSSDVVSELHRQGLKIFLLTGDNARAAWAIGAQLGIPAENVIAEVRPENKSDFVKKLQSQGERVAFVGDGINDGPALEQADLGIAVSRASDLAREAADIILLNSEIGAVPESLALARATLRTIKQNLFWAFFYNALGIPLAALGFMSPILCAAAMGVSDLVVIGNALRLRSWRH